MRQRQHDPRGRARTLLTLLLLCGLPAAAWADRKVLVNPPAFRTGAFRANAQESVYDYAASIQPTFKALDAVIAAPGEDVPAAAETFRGLCEGSLNLLNEAKQKLEKHKTTPKLGKVYVQYFADQRKAWAYTMGQGGRAATLLAKIDDTIRIWSENWIPKLRIKKKKFRSTAEDLNAAYAELAARAGLSSDARFETSLRGFKAKLNAARVLTDTTVALRDFLDAEIKNTNPTSNLAGEHAALARWKALEAAYGDVIKAAASMREQTVFRTENDPIGSLKKFEDIHPTFKALYDKLSKGREDWRARAEAEEKRWEEDHKRIVELADKYGPLEEREHKLEVARAGGETRLREADVARAGKTGGAAYAKLWRRLVEDKEYTRSEMEKQDTPEFRRAWRKIRADAESDYQQVVGGVNSDVADAEAQLETWHRERDLSLKEIDRIEKENARRRKELGMPSRKLN